MPETEDILADGYHERVYYQVEANFYDCTGWKRNFVEHKTVEAANKMLLGFRKMQETAEFRVVKVVVTQSVIRKGSSMGAGANSH